MRTDGIGDLVFFLKYLDVLKRLYPESPFFLVARNETVGIVPRELFDATVYFRYLAYRWNYFYRLLVLSRIHHLSADTAIYASYHRQHIGDELTLLSGASDTIAFAGNDEIIHPEMRKVNDRYYSRLVPTEDHIPEAVKYRALLKEIGSGDSIEVPSSSKSLIGAERKSQGRLSTPYFVIGPGGSASIRRWPAERFATLMEALITKTEHEAVIVGNKNDRQTVECILQKMSSPAHVLIDRSLAEVVGVIESAKFFIGNESGLLHIAANLGTPALGILGGGHFTRYFPYGSARIVSHKLPCYECNWKCPFPEPYCLTNITVEDVLKEIQHVLP